MRRRHLLSLAFCLTAGLGAVLPARAVPAYDFAPVSAEMQQFVQTHQLDGASLLVRRSGNVIYRQSFGGYGDQTRIRIASATKWLSGLTIARLIDKGQMRWTDTVGQYFPTVAADRRAITLEQLFSHTSAIDPTDNTCLSNPLFTLASCAERILQTPLIGAPGQVFAYGGNSMQVAGRMAELATGKAWDDIFLDELVRPLGLVATDFATSSTAPGYVRNANPRIAGGVRSSLDDYGRVIDMVLAKGCLQGFFPANCTPEQRFLSIATIDAMARDRTIGTTDVSRPAISTGFGYGFGMWIENADGVNAQIANPILSSPGAFGVTPWVNYASGAAGVLFVQDQLARLNADIVDIRAMVEVIAAGPGRRYKPTPHRAVVLGSAASGTSANTAGANAAARPASIRVDTLPVDRSGADRKPQRASPPQHKPGKRSGRIRGAL